MDPHRSRHRGCLPIGFRALSARLFLAEYSNTGYAARTGVGMDVWVVIAAFNEEKVIGETIRGLLPHVKSIVVVDDGSTDETSAAARATKVRVLRHVVNLGQGAALQTGIDFALASGATHICTFDADGQHPPTSISDLVEAIELTGADVVLGSRFLASTPSMPRSRRYLLLAARAFTRLQTGLRLTDVHNGLRLFTRDAAEKLRLKQPRMAHASEILSLISKNKLKFIEVPTSIAYTPYSLAKGQSMMGSFKILFDIVYAAWSR